MKHILQIILATFFILLAGCSSGAVAFVPTPAPSDISPLRYEHPGTAFVLVVPRQWAVYEQNTAALATASFTPPGEYAPSITVAVMNLGQVVDDSQMRQLMLDYQTEIRPDVDRYAESDRQVMNDGSWRLTGLRETASGETLQINTFFTRLGTYIGVIEVVLPADATLNAQMQAIINTFAINPDAPLQPTSLSILSSMTPTNLEILHVSTWMSAGVFFITGEVANYGGAPVANVPVQAVLSTDEQMGVSEALDVVMGYAIPPGGFAPFSLRFGGGQPSETVNYSLSIGDAEWQPGEVPTVYGADFLVWTDETSYNQNDQLIVSGTVTNNGEQIVSEARAVVTVFNEARNVIAAGFADVDRLLLPPGETATYFILVPDIGGAPANYIVNVQGLVAESHD